MQGSRPYAAEPSRGSLRRSEPYRQRCAISIALVGWSAIAFVEAAGAAPTAHAIGAIETSPLRSRVSRVTPWRMRLPGQRWRDLLANTWICLPTQGCKGASRQNRLDFAPVKETQRGRRVETCVRFAANEFRATQARAYKSQFREETSPCHDRSKAQALGFRSGSKLQFGWPSLSSSRSTLSAIPRRPPCQNPNAESCHTRSLGSTTSISAKSLIWIPPISAEAFGQTYREYFIETVLLDFPVPIIFLTRISTTRVLLSTAW